MEDRNIIELYFERNEKAIECTQQKYGKYCYAIAYGILDRHEDSEECVNDTWLRAWNSMPPHRPNSLRAFLGKITRNLALDRYKFNSRKKRGEAELAIDELAECIPSPETTEDYMRTKELSDALNSFLESLSETERNIFIARYFFVYPIEKIAKKLGMSRGGISNNLTSTKKKLREYLKGEGF